MGRTRPAWWNEGHTTAWERVKDALRRDWEQTKADLGLNGRNLHRNASTTVHELRSDATGPRWEEVEDAIAYGHGVGMHFGSYAAWDERLDAELHKEWESLKTGRTWREVRDLVRRGFQAARR